MPCLPTNTCGLIAKQGGAGHNFKQHARSFRDRGCPDEPTSFWFSPRTTSPCWQDSSPLSQGLLLAGSNTPAYAGHGTFTCPQEGQEKRTVAVTPEIRENEGPAKGRHREPWQDELERVTKDVWPVMPSAQLKKRKTSAVGSSGRTQGIGG